MVFDVGDPWAVGASALTWATVSLVVGYRANQWPPQRLEHTGLLTTMRRWERGGAFWQRWLRVRSWKDRLPEAGAFFAEGTSTRRIPSRSTADLGRFRRETVRAERVHWAILASTPVHLLWCRPTVMAGMVAFGVLFNAPFIVIQRFNRGRLERVIARRSRSAPEWRSATSGHRDAATAPADLAQEQGPDRGEGEDPDEEDHQ